MKIFFLFRVGTPAFPLYGWFHAFDVVLIHENELTVEYNCTFGF